MKLGSVETNNGLNSKLKCSSCIPFCLQFSCFFFNAGTKGALCCATRGQKPHIDLRMHFVHTTTCHVFDNKQERLSESVQRFPCVYDTLSRVTGIHKTQSFWRDIRDAYGRRLEQQAFYFRFVFCHPEQAVIP